MRRKFRLARLILAVMFGLLSIVPIRIAIAFHQHPTPQAIFVLGGGSDRMEFAAHFWQLHRNLPVWVSDFASGLDDNRRIFQKFGVPGEKLRLDGKATDTVTNFTTLVGDFVKENIHHVYLITSDYHIRRARAIASIVFGSRGVVVTPIAVASSQYKVESSKRVLRDFGRSLLWLVTNRTGASLNPKLKLIQPHLLRT